MDRLVADSVSVVIATTDLELREGGHSDHDEHNDEGHDEYAEGDDHGGDEHDEDMEEMHEEDEDHEEEDSHEGEEEHDEHEDEHDHGAYDPHTWLDPVLMTETVTALTAAIVALDPDNAATYQANAAVLVTELASIDAAYSDRLANCSLDEVIVSHDAFEYVADRYNFEVHAIAGLSTQDTPSAATMADLRAEAEEGIGAILLEENAVSAYGETLARETGLQTLSINPIAYLVPEGDTYTTLMQQNLDSFAAALACDV